MLNAWHSDGSVVDSPWTFSIIANDYLQLKRGCVQQPVSCTASDVTNRCVHGRCCLMALLNCQRVRKVIASEQDSMLDFTYGVFNGTRAELRRNTQRL